MVGQGCESIADPSDHRLAAGIRRAGEKLVVDLTQLRECLLLQPLPREALPVSSTGEALEAAMHAPGVEGVVLHPDDAEATIRANPTLFSRDGTCLITGGLGGLGLALARWLVERGGAHFPKVSSKVREKAAELLVGDRAEAKQRGLCPPGQAEYLDLLRAVRELAEQERDQLGWLERIAEFALKKHPADGAA